MKQITRYVIGSSIVHVLGVLAVWVQKKTNSVFKFEDIDYTVFTDAAEHVWNGESPYRRATYRYTPLMAYGLLPNNVFRDFGKLLFSMCTVLAGVVVYRMLLRRGESPDRAARLVFYFWMGNPLVVSIAARGNSDTVVSLLVVLMVHLFETGHTVAGGAVFGLAVHLRIYPVVYVSTVLFYFHRRRRECFKVFLVSGGVFFGLLGVFYSVYGRGFLYETYLYHAGRIDVRHNLSPYFYVFYLFGGESRVLGLGFTVLVFGLAWGVGCVFGRDDPVCSCFLQTFIFVMFNKVSTFQYLLWYVVFMPFLHFGKEQYLGLSAIVFSLSLWNSVAYCLEFRGVSCFPELWLCSLCLFCSNVFFVSSVIGLSQKRRGRGGHGLVDGGVCDGRPSVPCSHSKKEAKKKNNNRRRGWGREDKALPGSCRGRQDDMPVAKG
ncbi:MAG: GPI mannosyltransferase 1 [Amphiamblys sp. WSBS2006]|nr:MAG: GPI mannosyltransferase 1 [Amphiamblys sp. WSBS2006]